MATERAGVFERPVINVEGQRVALGPYRRDHIPIYQAWINDFGTIRTLKLPPGPMTVEQETAWYDSMGSSSTTKPFVIYERTTWRPVGGTNLHEIDYRHRTASFGIMVGAADCRGKGYGTEATRLMLDYAFTALGLHSVMLTVYAFNVAGQRAYAKAGFKEIGRRRECRWMGGRFWDEIYMDCLAEEFVSPVLGRVFVPDEPRS